MTDPIAKAFADAGLMPEPEPESPEVDPGPPGAPRNPAAGTTDPLERTDPLLRALDDIGI
ncbi:hypothetical protein [Amycolatopsis rubida]|uniref:Uncharacterized protein n=1 Tax=Amycolatopsis rubida TaxID=112413 RepID=A0A1I5MI80_9PSEU|nr:hypothetical protein [Amycolatopsis rubida]SFP08651.1 hypothetical protein SAMN05421854_10439 [Amycolatopsis rubida]